MCEILIKLSSATHPDPSIDKGLFKADDVVSVEDDGHDWGSSVLNSPDFRIVYLPGVAKAYKSYLIDQHKNGITHTAAMKIPELNNIAVEAPQSMKAIRRFAIDSSGNEIDKGQI